MSLIVLTSTVLVLLAACDANVLMPIAPLRRILVTIGARSYGIYLAHVPVYFAVREIFHRLDWQPASTGTLVFTSLALCGLLLMIAVEVVYRNIETPLRQIGARKAQLRLSHGLQLR
jgi:peptidoglycan/LPS O-acetylase OafA/YrhL